MNRKLLEGIKIPSSFTCNKDRLVDVYELTQVWHAIDMIRHALLFRTPETEGIGNDNPKQSEKQEPTPSVSENHRKVAELEMLMEKNNKLIIELARGYVTEAMQGIPRNQTFEPNNPRCFRCDIFNQHFRRFKGDCLEARVDGTPPCEEEISPKPGEVWKYTDRYGKENIFFVTQKVYEMMKLVDETGDSVVISAFNPVHGKFGWRRVFPEVKS